MLDALADCTDEPGRISRLSFGAAHVRAARLVAEWMRDAGLEARVDAAGTVRGIRSFGSSRAEAHSGRRRLLIGSHIDTVPDAGRFDGMLGVVTGILAVSELVRRGAELPFDVELLAFGDEEGLRFPGASIGSLSLAAALPQDVLETPDAQGVELGQALRDFRQAVDPESDPHPVDEPLPGSLALDPAELVGYLEVHIEQGPVLESENAPLGVVTSIAAASRLRVKASGAAGHAGTVPMAMRRDALAAAAEMIVAVESIAGASTGGLVATVGELVIESPAANSIPGAVTFSVDLRAPFDEVLAVGRESIVEALHRVGRGRDVTVDVLPQYDGRATICDDRLSAVLASTTAQHGVQAPHLPSGAGHDAQSIAAVTPVGMLFVRSRGGASHVPDEYSWPSDCGLAVSVLVASVLQLADARPALGLSPDRVVSAPRSRAPEKEPQR
jgi:allantoate deiminase